MGLFGRKKGPAAAAPASTAPFTPAADGLPVFESHSGALWVNGQRLHLKGTNWFGLETADRVLHGLWARPLPALLDFVASQGFNALRLPFSVQLVEELETVKPTNLGGGNEALMGLTAGAQLDAVVSEAARRGILIMLDCHHMEAAPSAIPELWYTAAFPEDRVIKAWQTLARRYARAWNVFAADLNNEPHGSASWGDGNAATDWRAGAERLGAAVLDANPRLLCFVEGTSGNAVPLQTPEPCFWGGGLCSAVAAPVTLPIPRRLVLSPHVYGPGVFMQSYFSDPAFPGNMPDIWTRQWAHPVLCGCEGGVGEAVPAIVPGEWGGRFEAGSLERKWALAFAQWQRETGLTDSFFWCLNPNSGDTGGLLSDDWQRPEEWKLALLAAINPAPTVFGPDGRVVDAGGGAAYAAPVGPLPEALTAGVDMTSRGGGGGGGGGGPSAPAAPAAPAPPQQPPQPAAGLGLEASAHHPSGLRLTSRVTSSWAAGPRTAYQMDVTVTNEGAGPVRDVVWSVDDASVIEQAWNCERAGGGGGAEFSLPTWCTQNGGLAAGASVTAGGVFFDAQPKWSVRPA